MLSLRAAVGASAAALLLLAGCGGDPDPGDPSSTWTPTGTPESPTSAATQAPVEPKLPQAATKATEDGARAFIGYYWELINYAQVTGDVKALKRASGPNCERCTAGITAVKDLYRSGGHLTDAAYAASISSVKQVTVATGDVYALEAKATISNAPHESVDAKGQHERYEASSVDYLLYVLWVRDHWRLDVMTRA